MAAVIIAHNDKSLEIFIKARLGEEAYERLNIIPYNNIITSNTVANTAQNLAKACNNNDDNILLLSLELPIANASPNELKAAELMYHLRATHKLHNPIVVVAMQTLSTILRQQPNLTILSAQGIYFADALSDFSFLQRIFENPERYKVKDLKKDYLPHFENKLNKAQVRHEQANIYGLKQLKKIHKAHTCIDLETLTSSNDEDLENKEMPLDFVLADFIFGNSEKDYNKVLIDYPDIIKELNITEKNILLIDDHGDDWKSFYDHLFFKKPTEEFQFAALESAHFDTNNNVNQNVWEVIEQKISESFIILLDLRLNPNYDNQTHLKLNDYSGIKLLKKIRDRFLYIPIIITTASNKSWILSKLAAMKVDGYWVKEGIDNGWTAKESVENYFMLPELVARATSPHYDALKKLFLVNQHLKKDTNCWFSDGGLWRNGDIRASDMETARVILHQACVLYKRHCRDFVINFNYSELTADNEESNLSIAGLINYLGSFFEIITGMDTIGSKETYKKYKTNIPFRVRFTPYNEIKNIRNKSSHAIAVSAIKDADVIYMVDLISNYVLNPRVFTGGFNTLKISYLAQIKNIEECRENYEDFDLIIYDNSKEFKGKHQNTISFAEKYLLKSLNNNDYVPVYKTTEVQNKDGLDTDYYEIVPIFLEELKKEFKYLPFKVIDYNKDHAKLINIKGDAIGITKASTQQSINPGFFYESNKTHKGYSIFNILSKSQGNYFISSNTHFDVGYKKKPLKTPQEDLSVTKFIENSSKSSTQCILNDAAVEIKALSHPPSYSAVINLKKEMIGVFRGEFKNETIQLVEGTTNNKNKDQRKSEVQINGIYYQIYVAKIS